MPRLNGTVFIHFDRVFDPGQVCIPIGLGNAEGVGDRENGWTADNFPQHVSAHHTLLPFGNGVYHLRSVSFGDLIEEGNFTIVA